MYNCAQAAATNDFVGVGHPRENGEANLEAHSQRQLQPNDNHHVRRPGESVASDSRDDDARVPCARHRKGSHEPGHHLGEGGRHRHQKACEPQGSRPRYIAKTAVRVVWRSLLA